MGSEIPESTQDEEDGGIALVSAKPSTSGKGGCSLYLAQLLGISASVRSVSRCIHMLSLLLFHYCAVLDIT